MIQRWPYFVLSGIGLLAVLVLLVSLLRPKEPSYQGQTLSYWCLQAQLEEGDRVTAFRALQTIGSDATPFLLRALHAQNSLPTRVHRAAWAYTPDFLRKHFPPPRPFQEALFLSTSRNLRLAGATPSQLLDGLSSRDADVRLAAVLALPHTLRQFGEGQTNLQETCLALVRGLLNDASADVRASAALCLGQIKPREAGVVPLLVKALEGTGLRPTVFSVLEQNAPEVLGKIGGEAAPARAVLTERLTHSNAFVRVPAAIALWEVAGDTRVPRLLSEELEQGWRSRSPEAPWICDRVLTALAEMGREAQPAEAIVRNIIDRPRRSWGPHHRTNIVEKARQALARMGASLEGTVSMEQK